MLDSEKIPPLSDTPKNEAGIIMVQLYALAQGRQPAARGQHVRGDILNEKTSFSPSPGKATTERRSSF